VYRRGKKPKETSAAEQRDRTAVVYPGGHNQVQRFGDNEIETANK